MNDGLEDSTQTTMDVAYGSFEDLRTVHTVQWSACLVRLAVHGVNKLMPLRIIDFIVITIMTHYSFVLFLGGVYLFIQRKCLNIDRKMVEQR